MEFTSGLLLLDRGRWNNLSGTGTTAAEALHDRISEISNVL